jgi:hypothetical protein
MKKSVFASLLAASAIAALSTPAFADVVTFDDAFSNANLFSTPSPISIQGLTFDQGDGIGALFPNGEFASQSNGTNNYIFAAGINGMTITRQGGGLFDLASLDMTLSWYTTTDSPTAPPPVDILTDDVTLTANTTGGVVVQTLTLFQGFQTYAVNLTGVSSLSITGISTGGNGYWGLDNLTGDNFGATIPEPGTWALMILGFGGAGAALRRRRSMSATA